MDGWMNERMNYHHLLWSINPTTQIDFTLLFLSPVCRVDIILF